MNPLNETSIIFNESLKALIREIRDLNPSGCISGLSSSNVDIILESQQTIRDWFASRINIRKGCKSHPDYYAILNTVICDIEQCYNWDDVFKQIETSHRFSQLMSYVYDDFDDVRGSILNRCICGHYCHRNNLAVIANPYTKLNCVTACDCITKVGIITKHAFKKASKNSRIAKIEKLTKFANLVFKYEVLRLGFRKCCDCLCYVVSKTDPNWKRRCFPCWRQANVIETGEKK